MAKVRKDNQNNILNKGESQRSDDGRYIYSYIDSQSGKRKFITANCLDELRKKEANLQFAKQNNMSFYDPDNMTLNDMFEQYITLRRGIKESTRAHYIYLYNKYVRDSLGRRPVKTISYSCIVRFYLYLCDELGLKAKSVRAIHVLVNLSLKIAVKDCLIVTNPALEAFSDLRLQADMKHARSPLPQEQQAAFLNYVRTSVLYRRHYPVMVVLFGTGMRIGEVSGLCWSDIDYEANIIKVERNYKHYRSVNEGYKEVIADTKTEAGKRIIPMLPEVAEAFREEALWQKKTGIKNVMTIGTTKNFVFCSRDGTMLRGEKLNKKIERIRLEYNNKETKKAKEECRSPVLIPHFTCHVARHTFCSRFCENETNIKVVQSVMGHAQASTTLDVYAKVNENQKQEAIKKLSENLKIF